MNQPLAPAAAAVEPAFRDIVRLEGVHKYFGAVHALKNISMAVGRNEIVGVIGDNGAGKSTLIKTITGVYKPTSGRIFVRDRELDLSGYSVGTAHGLSIESVYQDKSLGEKQPLWRNFFVGREITDRFGFISIKKEKQIAGEILLDTIGFRGVGISVDSTVNVLSGGERQGIAIGRAMHFNSDLIILDEPTAALGVKEVRKVLDFVRRIKAAGHAAIYIEHNLAHVHEVADRMIVLDRGEIVAEISPKDMTVAELTEYLIDVQPQASTAAPVAPAPTIGSLTRIEGLPIILVFALILGLFMCTAPEVFLAPNIYTTFLSSAPPLILLATGLTFVIGAGEIDLSFPAVISFSGFIFAILFKDYGLGWIAVLAALASGVLVGLVNGFLIARIGIPSFIATLGTQFFWAGVATVLSGGKSYALRGAEDTSVWGWIVGRFGNPSSYAWQDQISIQSAWTLLIVIFLWFILNRHRFGEHVLFIGDSNDVSRVVGINVVAEKIKLYTLMGALASIAAMMLTLENRNFFGNQGQGYLLTAIAAVLIGGTSIFGGRATIVGTIFGCCIIWILEAGLVATGLTGAWVRTMQGLIFLISIIFYRFVEEPHRRADFFARFKRRTESGRIVAAGEEPAPDGAGTPRV